LFNKADGKELHAIYAVRPSFGIIMQIYCSGRSGLRYFASMFTPIFRIAPSGGSNVVLRMAW